MFGIGLCSEKWGLEQDTVLVMSMKDILLADKLPKFVGDKEVEPYRRGLSPLYPVQHRGPYCDLALDSPVVSPVRVKEFPLP